MAAGYPDDAGISSLEKNLSADTIEFMENADSVLKGIDRCRSQLEAARGSDMKTRKAEVDMLVNIDLFRDLLRESIKNNSEWGINRLTAVFGGDCVRIAHLEAMLASTEFVHTPNVDQRLFDIQDACADMEGVLIDRGCGPALQKAKEDEQVKCPRNAWNLEQTITICKKGEEAFFEGKARLLSDFSSVAKAVKQLNDDPELCPEGFCVVYSDAVRKYVVIYKLEMKPEVDKLFGLCKPKPGGRPAPTPELGLEKPEGQPEAPEGVVKLAATKPPKVEVLGGFISDGGDILVAKMTVEEARIKCTELPDCKGFCHRGPATSEPRTIYFKNKFDNHPGDWTSFKVVRIARAGLDTNKDGTPNVIVEGVDMDGDGIPDILQRKGHQAQEVFAPNTRIRRKSDPADSKGEKPLYTIVEVRGARDSKRQYVVIDGDGKKLSVDHDDVEASTDMTRCGVDTTQDGEANFRIKGHDTDGDHIPDVLQ